jgi:tetratricopeptide (TPR) repeat protein
MKADHRHELKTNELAEWIANLPQWAKDNRTTIIGAALVIVVAAGLYYWRFYRKNVVSVRRQLTLTSLFNQLSLSKMQILRAQSEGRDLSFILVQPAENLKVFAQDTKDDQMTALALIKRAEALRTELHYRLGPVSPQDLVTQIKQAKASYSEALERAPSNPSLMATAKFGLGLCEEELGNFEQARQIYQEVADSEAFAGTAARAAAQHRLDTMADYQTKVVFKPAPPVVFTPIEPGPSGPNLPAGIDLLTDVNLPLGIELGPPAPNLVPLVPDSNISAAAPNSLANIAEANVPDK